jgi:hypothetical protein
VELVLDDVVGAERLGVAESSSPHVRGTTIRLAIQHSLHLTDAG